MRKLCGRIRLSVIGICAAVMLLVICQQPAGGVIVLGGTDANGTSDPGLGRNLNPAPNNLSNYVGTWGAFLGTPIAPRYFITANHIGNAGSGTFLFNNGTATQTTYTGVTLAGSNNDLAIWKISDSSPAFTLYAPLYTASTEAGNALVDIGRGTARGTVVNSPSPSTGQAGWNWVEPSDSKISWGTNTVGAIVTKVGVVTQTDPPSGFGGDFLKWSFNNNGNPNTGILSDGDSGGPTFVFNPTDAQYELAGINSLVDTVSQDQNGSGLTAALYDARGFWDGPNQVTGSDPVPLSSYSTRISSEISFIDGITGVPEPGSLGLLTMGMAALMWRRRGN